VSCKFIDGFTSEQLRRTNREAYATASKEMKAIQDKVLEHFNLPRNAGITKPIAERRWALGVDFANEDGFRFDAAGHVVGWFDPLTIDPIVTR
jgi:hypothetical protein